MGAEYPMPASAWREAFGRKEEIMNEKQGAERADQDYYAAIGRRVEAEQKRLDEERQKQSAQATEDERFARLMAEALRADEKRQRHEAKAKLGKALGAAILVGGAAFYVALFVEEVKA
jgi:hypothetical protein